MATSVSISARYVCRACRSNCSIKPARQHFVWRVRDTELNDRIARSFIFTRAASTRSTGTVRPSDSRLSPPKAKQATASPHGQQTLESLRSKPAVTTDTSDASSSLLRLRNEVNAIAASDEIPDQARILELLERSYNLANLLIFGQTVSPDETTEEAQGGNDNIRLLSDLEEDGHEAQANPTNAQVNLPVRYREKASAEVCETIYGLLKDPKVALNEDVLAIYVRTICQLGHPEYLPEVFFLFANKPLPLPNTKPVQFSNPSPSAAKNAIPQQLSDVALDTAILQRDLPLAIAIIDTTVATPAFRRNKFLRKGSIPLAAAGSTPLVAWAGAEWLAQWQDTFDPSTSKYMTMMGAMAYIGTLGTVGFIALTTWNDHHDRVVWTPGTPLRHRWSREEERLYFDRLAVAWGFQKTHRRGEEMGEEWEALREILGERSMVLDKSDLLEGMQ